MRLALAAVAAQLLDLGTFHPLTEANPLVLALGSAAPYAKLGLIAFVLVVAFVVARTRYRAVSGFVLGTAVVVGCIGALSNVVALR